MRNFLDFMTFVDPMGQNDVTELLIISCLQSIILDKSNEIFDYTFHGFEGKKGNRKGKACVQDA